MLSVGQLDRRIEVKAPDYTQNKFGEKTTTYATVYTLWSKVDWKRSDRGEENQEQTQSTDVIFYVRNVGVTILGTYQITYDSKIYIIHGIKEIDGRDRFLEIVTKIKDNQ